MIFHFLRFQKCCQCICRKLSNGKATARNEFVAQIEEELSKIKSDGTFKSERIINGPQSMEIYIKGHPKPLLNFCANNYLGLSSHPAIVQAGQICMENYGVGLSSVRFICGTQEIHRQLEKAIARFHGRPDAILYGSCFDANAGLFEVITGSEDAVLSDELNHASIIDGIRLCKAKRLRYRHMDMYDLEEQLKQTQKYRRRIIVTDGVFSMDGDEAPLRDIFQLANNYHALVVVDDCHATGFVGRTGRGTEEACDMFGRTDIITSTLGKAMGGAMGGYTTGPGELITLLRQRSRPYLFSNSLPPAVVGSALKAFELLSPSDGNSFSDALLSNVVQFRTEMANAGFQLIGNSATHPICPILIGDARLAREFADAMLKEGIYVIGFSYPVVPKDRARIRVQISAAHAPEHIEECIDAFKRVGKHMGIIC